MVGITVTASGGNVGLGASVETGIIASSDKNGNWQVGTYQVSGGGIAVTTGVGASATVSVSVAPFAETISDIEGPAMTLGGSGTLGIFVGGGDVNMPIDGPVKNFSISLHGGVGLPGAEVHGVITNTTTQVYGEGGLLSEAWGKAVESGMLKDIPQNVVEHFKDSYLNISNDPAPYPVFMPVE
jgi:hypothetical protein